MSELLLHEELESQAPREGIKRKMSHHADLILSPALESKEEEGLKNLGLEKGRARGEWVRELVRSSAQVRKRESV